MRDLVIAFGGAPTAVFNASLYDVVQEAKQHLEIGTVWGAVNGVQGILDENFVNFSAMRVEQVQSLLGSPSIAIGTSRAPLEAGDYDRMAESLHRRGIGCALIGGGNGTMDTCGKLGRAVGKYGIGCVGIPKTIDNDIAVIDHAPGFGSAARYVTISAAEAAMDVLSMPIHVCILETMGRNAGWLAAASALARRIVGIAPHLIYLPE